MFEKFLEAVDYYNQKVNLLFSLIENVDVSYNKHYNNIINYLLNRISINKYFNYITVLSKNNDIDTQNNKIDLYWYYKILIRLPVSTDEYIYNKVISNIFNKLVEKELEKNFWYISIWYKFYNEVVDEFDSKKFYYWFYYYNVIYKKYKIKDKKKIEEFLKQKFKNKKIFEKFFNKYKKELIFNIIDLLSILKYYIKFFQVFKKEILFIWLRQINYYLKANYQSTIYKEERNNSRQIKKYGNIWNYYLKNKKKLYNLLKKLLFKKININFVYDNFEIILKIWIEIINIIKKEKITNKDEIKKILYEKYEVDNFKDFINLNLNLENLIIELESKILHNNHYEFSIFDFIIINKQILNKVVFGNPETYYEKFLYEYLVNNYNLEDLKKIEKQYDNIYVIEDDILNNILDIIRKKIDIEDKKIIYNIITEI